MLCCASVCTPTSMCMACACVSTKLFPSVQYKSIFPIRFFWCPPLTLGLALTPLSGFPAPRGPVLLAHGVAPRAQLELRWPQPRSAQQSHRCPASSF